MSNRFTWDPGQVVVMEPQTKSWNEEDHPREPAGSPDGGQFTDGGSGGLPPTIEGVDLDRGYSYTEMRTAIHQDYGYPLSEDERYEHLKAGIEAYDPVQSEFIRLTEASVRRIEMSRDQGLAFFQNLPQEELERYEYVGRLAWPIGPERTYFRLGAPPPSGRSYNARDGRYELGVSVYITPVAGSFIEDRTIYSGTGRQIGWGGDEEPVVVLTSSWNSLPKLMPEKIWHITKVPSPRYVHQVIDDADDEGDDFADELNEYGDELPDERLEQAVKTGSPWVMEQVVNVVALGALAYAFWQPKLHAQAAERARTYATDEWPKDLPPFGGGAPAGVGPRRGELGLRFNQMDARAGEWASRHAAQLVTHITDAEKDRIAQLVSRSKTEGLTVQQVARELRFVGLLPQHQTAVARYQRELAAEGRPMDQVLRMADKYKRSLLNFRTRMIARQELLTATHQGQLTAVLDAIQHGEIDPSRTVRHWHTADDELACNTCRPMDGKEAPADEPWTVELRNSKDEVTGVIDVMIPQDVHIQCRCSWSLVTHVRDESTEREG